MKISLKAIQIITLIATVSAQDFSVLFAKEFQKNLTRFDELKNQLTAMLANTTDINFTTEFDRGNSTIDMIKINGNFNASNEFIYDVIGVNTTIAWIKKTESTTTIKPEKTDWFKLRTSTPWKQKIDSSTEKMLKTTIIDGTLEDYVKEVESDEFVTTSGTVTTKKLTTTQDNVTTPESYKLERKPGFTISLRDTTTAPEESTTESTTRHATSISNATIDDTATTETTTDFSTESTTENLSESTWDGTSESTSDSSESTSESGTESTTETTTESTAVSTRSSRTTTAPAGGSRAPQQNMAPWEKFLAQITSKTIRPTTAERSANHSDVDWTSMGTGSAIVFTEFYYQNANASSTHGPSEDATEAWI